MPLYEYECRCGFCFEALNPMAERHKAICPNCGRLASKSMSVANHSFGWVLSDRSLNVRFAPKEEFVKNV